jgi:hypothetical protein
VQLKRLVVGKGKTSRPSEGEEWAKDYYEIEVSVENLDELEADKAKLCELIDSWLSMPKPSKRTAPKSPQPDPVELEKLPWKTYQYKEACEPDEAGWIFRNTQGAEALADLINKADKETVIEIGIHKFEVKFSGKEKQFIGRALLKLKKGHSQGQVTS